jgi:hypothetical protein
VRIIARPTRTIGNQRPRGRRGPATVMPMRNATDDPAAKAFAERYAAARAHLRAQMEAAGLHESEGWRVSETTSDGHGGYRVTLKPIHSRLPTPEGIECVVWIEEDGGRVDAECVPGGRPA